MEDSVKSIPPEMHYEVKRRRRSLTLLTLLLLVVLGVGAVFYVKGRLTKFVEANTGTAAMALPDVGVNPDETQQTISKFMQFRNKLTSPAPPGESELVEIVLSGPEVNALIARIPRLQRFANQIRVSIEGSQLTGHLSVPLDRFGYPGRFLNGVGKFSVSAHGGKVYARLTDFESQDGEMPEKVMKHLRKRNLMTYARRFPALSGYSRRIEHIEVREDKVYLTAKRGVGKDILQ